jgi:hypothetical protein|uniref:Uncharacterized protein n=1 Tax=Podoviridae sp. ctz6O13 TaxID=2827757 RepID=A0A8S5TL45_9CAUD|nr:MAG TPA: hypothetical protein [Podoviridae sp. ctz6O13]
MEKITIDRVLHYIKRKIKTTEDGKEVVSKLHDELAAKMAFEGGRQSVIDNIPELEWKVCVGGYYTETPIGDLPIWIDVKKGNKYILHFFNVTESYSTLVEAEWKANESYKGILIKALGIGHEKN